MDKRKDPKKTPGFHITASYGWMNDPCGPGYDPKTDTYHLFYQWNPEGCEWGNMSWGHVTSKDLVHWQRTGIQPSLKPDQPYDKEGVFTGCFHPTDLRGSTQGLTVFYSSICNLPFSWETPPYPRGSAGIAVATSEDGGLSWKKLKENPIIAEEPVGVHVTGYRDPFIGKWPSMAALDGNPEALYAMVAGGVQDAGPAMFFYAIDPQNLLNWTYKGRVFHTPTGFRPSRKWNGDAGVNWECPSFGTIGSSNTSRDFILYGTEGGEERDHVPISDKSLPQRTRRWCLWACGALTQRSNGDPCFEYNFGGLLDHGCFYAANSFQDPKSNRRIVWGWIVEEDVTIERCRAKGWTGSLAIPREISPREYHNVVGASRTPIAELSSFDFDENNKNGCVLRTLGIVPLPEISNLRTGKGQQLPSPVEMAKEKTSATLFGCGVVQWESAASFSVGKCSQVGIRIKHGKSGNTSTEIIFSPTDEQISVVRPTQRSAGPQNGDSNMIVNNREERGSHTLLKFASFSESGNLVEKSEKLELRIFRDGQVLEVFANDRFALATMIYPDNEDDGIYDQFSCFFEPDDATDTAHIQTVLEQIQLWEMAAAITDPDLPRPSVHSSL